MGLEIPKDGSCRGRRSPMAHVKPQTANSHMLHRHDDYDNESPFLCVLHRFLFKKCNGKRYIPFID